MRISTKIKKQLLKHIQELEENRNDFLKTDFCEIITLQAIVTQKHRKYIYKVNFTLAINFCLTFFKYNGNSPPKVEELIATFVLPVRENRKSKRKTKEKSFTPFNYRG